MEKDIYLNGIQELAKKYKKWILTCVLTKEKNKIRNRSVLVNPSGLISTYYDKIHMYDVVLSKKEKYLESKTFSFGRSLKTTNLPWGKLGLSICYDVRFPNMFRKLSKKGSLFISVPSAFTETTGKKHWHSLLKARAIENFCYIFAPAQYGTHWNGRKTYGHSLIISPDGKILKELKRGNGVITANIDPKISKDLRKRIPSLKSD
jgi:predicted amidohydrolase